MCQGVGVQAVCQTVCSASSSSMCVCVCVKQSPRPACWKHCGRVCLMTCRCGSCRKTVESSARGCPEAASSLCTCLSVCLLPCICRPSFDAICDTLEGLLAQEQARQAKLAALIQQEPHTVSPPALQQPSAHAPSAAAAGAPAGSCIVPAPAAAGEAGGAGGVSPGSPFSPFAAIADEHFASGSTTNIQQT